MEYPIEDNNGTLRDAMVQRDAESMRRDIEDFWAARGYEVKTWVERFDRTPDLLGRRWVYCVRSDMVDGLPVRRLPQ